MLSTFGPQEFKAFFFSLFLKVTFSLVKRFRIVFNCDMFSSICVENSVKLRANSTFPQAEHKFYHYAYLSKFPYSLGFSLALPSHFPRNLRLPVRTWCPFLESPETFRVFFEWHNSLCIFKNKGVSRHETLQLFEFLFPLQRVKRPASQNKRVGVLWMAFRARKAFGTFEKRAPGVCFSKLPRPFRTRKSKCNPLVLKNWSFNMFLMKEKLAGLRSLMA